MLRLLFFVLGIIILIIPEFLKVYYIMPFPGSQEDETIRLAYMLHNYIWVFRIIGIAMIAWPAWTFIRSGKIWTAWPTAVVIGLWLFVAYVTNFVMLADKLFLQPTHKEFVSVADNKISLKEVIIGVTIDGQSKAYPIEIIGYHHQVTDNFSGKPVMVTYCTVCRTGRVFSPVVDGVEDNFRLVGMDHYNAMFEDSRTRSWWRQVNGEAIVGELKGKHLEEIPSEQMSLSSWIAAHPDTKIMQRDEDFTERYDSLALYDEGKQKGRLEGTDSTPWQNKSWVIGVQTNDKAKAYDWIETLRTHVVNDTIGSMSIVVAIEPDNASFHVWQTAPDLKLTYDSAGLGLRDSHSNSLWNWQGKCVEGKLAGHQLTFQQAYQEYWHSWKTFRPHTTTYRVKSE